MRRISPLALVAAGGGMPCVESLNASTASGVATALLTAHSSWCSKRLRTQRHDVVGDVPGRGVVERPVVRTHCFGALTHNAASFRQRSRATGLYDQLPYTHNDSRAHQTLQPRART